ncbi:MAG TPA: hypothetical protein DD412_05275 [Holosporales bacterium]|nr:hypothetical protein [Holosporales bacterium]
MKLKIFILLGTFLFTVIASPVCADQSKYKSPWRETGVHLNALIKDGYGIVGTNFGVISLAGAAYEVIYLKKGSEVFRCSTFEKKDDNQHGCEILDDPERNL